MPNMKYSMIPWEEWKEDSNIPEWVKKENEGLYRIRAERDINVMTEDGMITKGYLGGFVEDEKSLSQEGKCFIHYWSSVRGGSHVTGDAQVRGHMIVADRSSIEDSAALMGIGKLFNTNVSGSALVYLDSVECKVVNSNIWNESQVVGVSSVYNSNIHDSSEINDSTVSYCIANKNSIVKQSTIVGNDTSEMVLLTNAMVERSEIDGNCTIDHANIMCSKVSSGEKKKGSQFVCDSYISKANNVFNCEIVNSIIANYMAEDGEVRRIRDSHIADSCISGSCTGVADSFIEKSLVGETGPVRIYGPAYVQDAFLLKSRVKAGKIIGNRNHSKDLYLLHIMNSIICDQAEIRDDVTIDKSFIKDHALIFGCVKVTHGATIGGSVVLRDHVSVNGEITLSSEEEFYDDEVITGKTPPNLSQFFEFENYRDYREA